MGAGQTTFDAEAPAYTTAGGFTIAVTVADGDETATATTAVSVNPVPVDVLIAAGEPAASESQQSPGEFTLTRDGDTSAALTVSYTIDSASTAVAGTDYTALSGTATFAADSATATIPVAPLDAGKVGGSVTVTVDLSTANPAIVPDPDASSATVTIFDDDLPTVSVVATTATATEADNPGLSGQFTVTRNGPTDNPLLVTYTLGGSAVNGDGYIMLPGDVIIPAGEASAAISIDPLDLGLTAGSQTVQLTLSAAANCGYQVSTGQASDTVTILDDDLPLVSIFPVPPPTSLNPGQPSSPAGFTITRSG